MKIEEMPHSLPGKEKPYKTNLEDRQKISKICQSERKQESYRILTSITSFW